MTMVFETTEGVTSWGRIARRTQRVARPRFSSSITDWAKLDNGPRLAAGLGRSYGDTGLYSDGRLISTRNLDRFLSFDATTGLVHAQAGLSLGALLKIITPKGWFLPVTPGTRHVTLGGAVASDVHGKNHNRNGSFGRHVKALTLLRSDRGVVTVTPETEPYLFAATAGGLGLTGVILDVTLQLQKIGSTNLNVERIPLGNVEDFFAIHKESIASFEQAVAWIDCTMKGKNIGRGVYFRANWASDGVLEPHRDRALTVPVETPGFAINRLSLAAFNALYRTAQLMKPARATEHYTGFFYPLDSLEEWNKVYGSAGLFQYQLVVPTDGGEDAIRAVLNIIGESGEGSALVVLKSFGNLTSPGMLSFTRPGYTLALDFRNRGQMTLDIFRRLDAIVKAAGGALYPAKDGRMSREMFELSFPKYEEFLRYRDPACGSDFLTRLGL